MKAAPVFTHSYGHGNLYNNQHQCFRVSSHQKEAQQHKRCHEEGGAESLCRI